MNLSLNKIREWKAKHKKTPLKPECAAVILAAGSSVRMGSDKILARLGELPVLARTLRPFQECSCVKEIVVWFDSRLLVSMPIELPEPLFVSKNKAAEFKNWMTSH